jgi:sec-independent protein translocase protein TatA
MGATELIVIALIIVLLFGASKLPELGRAVGEGVSNLKRGLRDANEEDKTEPPANRGA